MLPHETASAHTSEGVVPDAARRLRKEAVVLETGATTRPRQRNWREKSVRRKSRKTNQRKK